MDDHFVCMLSCVTVTVLYDNYRNTVQLHDYEWSVGLYDVWVAWFSRYYSAYIVIFGNG